MCSCWMHRRSVQAWYPWSAKVVWHERWRQEILDNAEKITRSGRSGVQVKTNGSTTFWSITFANPNRIVGPCHHVQTKPQLCLEAGVHEYTTFGLRGDKRIWGLSPSGNRTRARPITATERWVKARSVGVVQGKDFSYTRRCCLHQAQHFRPNTFTAYRSSISSSWLISHPASRYWSHLLKFVTPPFHARLVALLRYTAVEGGRCGD